MAEGDRRPLQDATKPRTVDATINLHKRLHKVGFKKRARKAVKAVREFAADLMRTSDVRVDPTLNRYIWNKGVRNVPRRVRVRMIRKVKEGEEEDGEKLYTVVTHVGVPSFKGLKTEEAKA